MKGIVHCDITQDPPIEPGYEGSYDIVVCSLVMEGASDTDEEYYANIARLGTRQAGEARRESHLSWILQVGTPQFP